MHTPVCDLLRIEHPIVLGGMAGHTSVPLVAAVSNGGGLGTLGVSRMTAAQITEAIRAIRRATAKPFGVNFLLFDADDRAVDAALAERPPVFAATWARDDQDLKPLFDRAHDAGAVVMYTAATVREAVRAKGAGADIVVALGTEGGGHVGWMATLALVPTMIDAISPTPVVAAGGIADGRGLAAALSLGAQGVLLGTRFLATRESPLHQNFKEAIVHSDGHDTVLSEIPDIARGTVWPGAMARIRRNAFIARWSGREWELRARRPEAYAALQQASTAGDVDEAVLAYGQDAGLIRDIPAAGDLIRRIVDEAETIIRGRLTEYVQAPAAAQPAAQPDQSKSIHSLIRHVLLHDWDPIGIADFPEARDEYNGYVDGVYKLLESGATVRDVAAHLAQIERDTLGLSTSLEGPRDVAEKLCALSVAIKGQ